MLQTVLSNLFDPTNVLFMFAGVIIGIIFGAIPGLSNTSGIALMLPVTFAMPAETAIIFLGSIYVGGMSGCLVSAILLGVPGAASSIATCFDGYPMSKNGKAGRALGIGIFSSAIATTASVFIAMLLTAPLARVAVKLGPWELFSLCVCAIVLVVTISKGNVFSGLISACLGICVGMVGIAPVDGAKRFTFGIVNLLGGIPSLAVALGCFAIANLAQNYAKGDTRTPEVDALSMKGIGIPLKEYFSYWKTILRSFGVGLWIGFLPGMGAALSNIVAYAMAKSSSKTPEKFGTGCEEGVIASEIANNAAIGGAIIPTIALGIPGDTACAMLLTGLMIQGIDAGPLLMNTNVNLVYTFFGILLLANLVTFAVEMLGARTFPYILKAPVCYLYSAIFLICMVGVYANTGAVFTCGVALSLTVLAVLMSYGNMNLSPFILGYILGPMMEDYLRKGMTYSTEGFIMFLQRPISLALLLIAAASLFWPFIRDYLQKKRAESGKKTAVDKAAEAAAAYNVED